MERACKGRMSDWDDELWDDESAPASPEQSYQAPEGGYVHHRFIMGPDAKVYMGNGGDQEFHEDIANQHGISNPRNPGEHLNGPYTLGTTFNDGRMQIHQHKSGLHASQVQEALAPHFPDHQVPTQGLDTPPVRRWPSMTDAEKSEQLLPSYQRMKTEEEKAVNMRGRPFGYYDNPFFNRGGKVSNDAVCQNCGHVATGPGYNQEVCETCGAPQPYMHQPNPTHSEMEMRNMPAPGEKDMGGNPLQEGFMADGGWQNRMKRDESFASVKKEAASVEDWTQGYGEPLENQHGGTCPQCHKPGLDGEDGSCQFCNYVIPYDGSEWQHQLNPKGEGVVDVSPHRQNLGDPHWGSAPFNEAEEEYEMDLESEKTEVAARIAAWDREQGMRNNFYMPWAVLDTSIENQKSIVASTRHEGFAFLAPLLAPLAGGLAGGGAAAAGGAAAGGAGAAAAGFAGRMAPSIAGHLLGNALEGHDGGGNAAPALNQPGAMQQSWDTLSSVHSQLVHGEFEHPSSNPGFDDTDDPEDVDQKEFNDGDHTNLDDDIDKGGGSDGFDMESPLGQAFTEALPSLLKYYDSPESGKSDPAVAKFVHLLEQEMPGTIGAQPSPEEMQAIQESLRLFKGEAGSPTEAEEPSAVGGKVAYAPGIGGMMPQPGTQMLQSPVGQPGGQVSPHTQGMCPQCGARVTPGQGVCPQCNGAIDPAPMGATAVNPQAPVGPAGQAVPPVMASIHNAIIDDRFSANQGPHNPEQFQAVKQYLEGQGRPELVQDLIDHPENYGDILAEIQNKQQPANPDPDPGPAPMPPPGAMPPQGMGDPSQGQMPMMAGKTAFEHDDLHAHPTAVPAADQVRPDDPAKDDNPGGIWSTQDGQPLVVGQEYEMYSAKYDVPDVVRIEAVKPDSIEYTLTGEYGLEHRTEISKQEADMDGLTFLPTDDQGGDPEAQMNEQGPNDQMAQMSPPGHDFPLTASAKTAEYADDLWDDKDEFASTMRTAGAKFTPMEQRAFIDEQGVARNSDKLDLKGTHYEAHEQAGLSDDFFLFGL